MFSLHAKYNCYENQINMWPRRVAENEKLALSKWNCYSELKTIYKQVDDTLYNTLKW